MDTILDLIPWGYKFDNPQTDGSLAVSFKARYSELLTLHILNLARQRGIEGIRTEQTPEGVRLGFMTANFHDPIVEFFREQALITKINKAAARKKLKMGELRHLAGRFSELFSAYSHL